MKQWSDKEILHLKKYYKNTKTFFLAKELNRTETSIHLKANKLGIVSVGNKNKIYSCNEKFFSNPNILNSYWAGFIAADGCLLMKPNCRLQIKLKDTEIYHLRKFLKDIKANSKIKIYDNGDGSGRKHCYIGISSKKIVQDLIVNYNITNKKSITLEPPKNLTRKQSLAFIAGYIDGDGCICVSARNQLQVKILGTYKLLEYIKNILNIPHKIGKAENIYALRFSGNKNVPNILREIKTLKLPFLKRKWDKI